MSQHLRQDPTVEIDERPWHESRAISPNGPLSPRDAQLLQESLQRAHATTPFYRAKFEAAGVDVGRLPSATDLARIPFTEKEEVRQSQQDLPPFGATQGVPVSSISRVQATGGSTGMPLLLPFTRGDLDSVYELGSRAVWCAGARPEDVVLECFNYSLYVGGLTDHLCFEQAGCCVLPYGTGQSERLLHMMSKFQLPLLLYSTPAYPLRLAEVAEGLGLNPQKLNVRKAILSGEGGLSSPGYRERIERIWDCEVRDLYGMAEVGCVASECGERNGLHLVTDGQLLLELIDPNSGEQISPEQGATGELVCTTLRREAGMLIRFRTHDLVQVFTDPCPCGRTGMRLKVIGRADDMFIVRGVNIYPLAVQDILWSFGDRVNGEFQIVLDKPLPIDYEPMVTVESDADRAPALAADIRDRVKSLLNFSADVRVVPAGTLPREAGKTKRLVRAYEGASA